jgi:hypothetical protein
MSFVTKRHRFRHLKSHPSDETAETPLGGGFVTGFVTNGALWIEIGFVTKRHRFRHCLR